MKGKLLKIAIMTRRLSNVMGGMERQLLSIASGLLDRGHEVTIISLDQNAAMPFFESNPMIDFIGLAIGDGANKATYRNRILRQKKVYTLFRNLEIDLAICFMTGSFWFSALPARVHGIPIVLAERNGPSIYKKTKVRRFRFFIYMSMLFASAITVQFEDYRWSYPFFLRRKIVAIPNKIPNLNQTRRKRTNPFVFLFAGRLSNQKQIVELVLSFLLFNKKHSDTMLLIYGEGEQKETIEGLIEKNSAEEFIRMHSPTKKIEQTFANANVMIAPSLWEGFPNSVAEALAAGLPVGGFSDCEGVRDLVISGQNGWLIDRSDPIISLIKLLEIIYNGRDEIKHFSENARLSVLRYQSEEANDKWNQLLLNLVSK